jgi:hypothetical protein
MKDTTFIECSECGGEAEFERDIDPWSGWSGHWRMVRHDCEYACANHPAYDPAALYCQLEEEEIGRAETAAEKQFADYHGANTPQTAAERAEVERQDGAA